MSLDYISNNMNNKKNNELNDKKTEDINNLTTDDIFRLMDLYFYRKNYMYRHLYDSYNKFIEEDVKNYLEHGDHIFNEKITKTTVYKQKFKYNNIHVIGPKMQNDTEIMFPSDARHHNLTYSIKLLADIIQIQEIIDIASGNKIEHVIGTKEIDYPVAYIPLMLRSKFCSLNTYKENNSNECEYDPGGYFIVNGSEKVIISQDRMVENKPLVFIKKDSGTMSYIVQVNSKSYKSNGMTQILNIKMKKDGTMTIRVPIFNEINVFTIFRALGIESDKDIIDLIVYDENDIYMIDLIRITLELCKNERGENIQTQEAAIDYLVNKLRVIKIYTETDKNIKLYQKKNHLMSLLKMSLLPHIEGGLKEKGFFLGYMINRLMRVYLGRLRVDDRDSYINKRVDLPGDLMNELFKQQYKKMLSECGKYFVNRNERDDKPINVINQIKPNMIEQGLKAALLTGSWIRRKGVAQMLQRFTFLQYIAFLRRIDSPGGDTSSNKLTSPRQLHPSSIGFLCLTGDTNILMADKTVKLIKDIKNGDQIISIYPETFIETPTKVKNWFCKLGTNLLEITTINHNVIKCTSDHKLLVEINNKYVMIEAEKIEINNKLITRNSRDNGFIIESIKKINDELVYDFETDNESHCFIANNIISHNCVVETPEHTKVGLTKHLSLIGSITIMSIDEYLLIKNILIKRIINLRDVPINKLNSSFKVFLNGEWLGITNDPYTLVKEMYEFKSNGTIDQKNVSIVPIYKDNEIRIYCDSGRLYRPMIHVENNIISLQKEHIKSISLNKADKTNKITDWDEFLIKYPNVIEYIDMELQPYIILSHNIAKIEEERQRMMSSIDKVKNVISDETNNRYNDLYFIKYNNCEFHSSLLLGEISTNVPFANHNAGPRNIFQYAQGRQAMGLYATNYRKRMDISYILYNPQKPLVTTRTAKYVGTEILPSGENVMVAIACYTGYNQEDSLIFNKTSVERGIFRSMTLKKYISTIQKNQSTAQDDVFMKPDPTKVIGMRHGSYEKLNDKGYVTEETTIVNGDIILGKVTPIQDSGNNNNKQFKDSSEIYRSTAPGVVDRVYIGIQNQDGHETRKILVRSDRTPHIGDKFCCYTEDHQILTTDGWISINKLTINHKVASLVNKGTTLKYTNPIKIFKYNIKDNLYVIDNSHIKLKVTKNHRMYVARPNCPYKIETTEKIKGMCVIYKKNVKKYNIISVTPTSYIIYDNKNIYMSISYDIWLQFYGYVFGHILLNEYNDFIITNNKIQLLLSSIVLNNNINISKDKNNIWTITDKCFIEQIMPFVLNGKFPNWVWTLSMSNCIILLTNLLLNVENKTFITKNVNFADDLQRLCLHAGCAANIYYSTNNIYTVKVLNINSCEITINKQNQYHLIKNINTGLPSDKYEYYDGDVYCCDVGGDGIIYIRHSGLPLWCGNSRHGQKGTCGILLNGIDMPFNKFGVRPDIIVNANAIPSRMTIGQLIECLVGKIGALDGFDIDGTPFENYDIDKIEQQLTSLGYDSKGYEELYNGMTGEKLKVMIFFGPTYYQRLKHMVEDKIHARSRGTRALLTRQPPEGRSRDGGLRLGEMERDAIIAHGLAKFLNEKMMYNSDAYTIHVCDICGVFAQRKKREKYKLYTQSTDEYTCIYCNNNNKISKILIPYAFKLLIQELMAMCIVPRIRTNKDLYY